MERHVVMSKHTPGPWTIDERRIRDGYYAAITAPKWHALADVVVRMSDEEEDQPEGVANAKLIAAAPDLLDVLQRMLDHGERCNWFADRGDYELVSEAREAIEKATR